MKYGKAVTIYAAYVLVFSTVINLVPTTIADAIENELNNNEGWWNDDWAFRKQITITEPIQGYQMEIMLAKNFNTEIRQDCVINCGNKCNPDFSDLRFIDEHNQLIPYWIAYIEDNIASFWLNLTSSEHQ